ncbi:Hydroxymethylpyrimidine/phosphomethylpyrimidine kinase [Pseudovibrio axinellae]|uniref:hydroxymethylpyrimidine kinase n=1 Tax=Pseudovibrio axinellae TaxID=989403 RepID=A0A166APS7_9HYPH|nr:bifunctional hydroxymethylpyrimidine kinase/phosphomethylpyrimidine kinase [Pseudovibrio axinellae]KZL21397.1 Hydroxymethylpyrimidine/phosphomethylpyrimidine kinase [Pseudovibrio axinellae]SEQ98682.1 hydroxymethylpyrimidine kinase /phosphomethylpyrimidine kinase [Pseudovibrio axinellae]
MSAIAVTIAGSDSGGGAGIQADLKAFSALGVYGASVITALTAQNTKGVSAIQDVPPLFVADQMDAVFSDLKVDAVKVGMLSQPEVIDVLATKLAEYNVTRLVLDPVMVATSGDVLLQSSAVSSLKQRLFPLAMMITPNMQEAAFLLDQPLAASREDMRQQALALLDLGAQRVLLKGGHGVDETCDDLFLTREVERWYSAPRYKTQNTHGTGCTLSSAIAAGLAKGLELEDAIGEAKKYISQAIRAADTLDVGEGHGPVHHFHEFWPK